MKKVTLQWHEVDDAEKQSWIKDAIVDLCDGSSQWIPHGHWDSADFDYDVLCVVRDRLSPDEIDKFGRVLSKRMSGRVEDGQFKAVGYMPGDYSASLYDVAVAMKIVSGVEDWCDEDGKESA